MVLLPGFAFQGIILAKYMYCIVLDEDNLEDLPFRPQRGKTSSFHGHILRPNFHWMRSWGNTSFINANAFRDHLHDGNTGVRRAWMFPERSDTGPTIREAIALDPGLEQPNPKDFARAAAAVMLCRS